MGNITYGTYGQAAFESEDFYGPRELRISDNPPVSRSAVKVGENVDLPAFSVVTYDGTTIALATDGGDKPYGITAAPVKTGAGESAVVQVFRSGHFNIDVLNFDASFNTTEKKLAAFEGAASPTVIILGENIFKDEALNY